jgi:hypothetical protein
MKRQGRRARAAPNVLATTTVKGGNFLPQFKKAAWGEGEQDKTQTAKEAGSTRLNETDLQFLRRMSLATGDALID